MILKFREPPVAQILQNQQEVIQDLGLIPQGGGMTFLISIVVAPDSFKESIDAPQAAELIEAGIKTVLPQARVVRVPVSDGGEGVTRTMVDATGGRLVFREVAGPLGDKIEGYFGILGDKSTAVVEMAAASGLHLAPRGLRNPMAATSYGTGELIGAAISAGCRKIIVGLGGSATNDGGAGMAQALGARLTDGPGRDIQAGARGLLDLEHIDVSSLKKLISGVEVVAACDVNNPLCGPLGAARVYGPQKGAGQETVEIMDRALGRLAEVIRRDLGTDVSDLPGSGAAGGMGAGLVAFLGAVLRPGTELVLEAVRLEEIIAAGVDLVITGEGEINSQTAYGKVPIGVARLAKKYGVPVIAIVGSIADDAEVVYRYGIDAMVTIVPRPMALAKAMEEAHRLLTDGAARTMRLFNTAMSVKAGVKRSE